MNKKHEKDFLDRLIKMHDEEEKAVNNQVAKFYENEERVDFFSKSSQKDPFAGIFSTLKKEPSLSAMTQEQMFKECERIRENIKRGDPDNTELNFVKDDTGADCAMRLYEFHSLSISENSDEKKEIGLMTSYSWMNAKVYAGIIMGVNLNPVKNLFLFSDVLKNKYDKDQKSATIAVEDKDYE